MISELHDQAVDRELMFVERKVVCAWHFQYFGTECVVRDGEEPVSHGICSACLQKARQERAA